MAQDTNECCPTNGKAAITRTQMNLYPWVPVELAAMWYLVAAMILDKQTRLQTIKHRRVKP